jgi:hypothetical protein
MGTYVPFNFIQQTYCILFLTNNKYANTHVYALVRFNQPNSEQPAGAKKAQRSIVENIFQRNSELPAGAEKASLELSPTLDRSKYISRQRYGGFEPASNR